MTEDSTAGEGVIFIIEKIESQGICRAVLRSANSWVIFYFRVAGTNVAVTQKLVLLRIPFLILYKKVVGNDKLQQRIAENAVI